MASKVSIVIQAKNLATRVFKSVTAGVKSMASSIASVGKAAAIGLGAIATAAAGLAIKSIMAFSVQEKATKGLEGALLGLGSSADEINKLSKAYQAIASVIQDETGVADENTLATITQLAQLGIMEDQMGRAARAVIALKSVGMEQAGATKAVSAALQGNYSLLTRYVPALKMATTEAEKAAIVNKLFTASYEQQRQELNTVAGGFAAVKGRIGDVLETIGGAIVRGLKLGETLATLGDKIKSIGSGDAFGGFLKRLEDIGAKTRSVIVAMSSGGEGFRETFSALGGVVAAALSDGATWAGNHLIKIAPIVGGIIGDSVRNAATSLWRGTADRQVAKSMSKQTGLSVEEHLRDIQFERLKGESEAAAKAFGDMASATEGALKKLDEVVKKHSSSVQEATNAIDATAGGSAGGVGDAGPLPMQFDAVKAKEEESADALKKRIKGLEDEAEGLQNLEQVAADNHRGIQEQIDAMKELASKRVVDMLASKKAADAEDKSKELDRKRAERLTKRQERGTKLSKGDKEFLDQFNIIAKAADDALNAQKALADKEAQAAAQREENKKTQEKIAERIQTLNKSLSKLLTAPEG